MFQPGQHRHPRPRVAALWLTALMLLLAPAPARLSRSPDPGRSSPNSADGIGQSLRAADLAVVVNGEDPLSEQIGAFYQRVRGLPASQVIRVRFPPGGASLDPQRFRQLREQILRDTPPHVQAYAMAWTAPWRVDCQSITSALTFGVDSGWCARGCRLSRTSPYFGRGDIQRPWDELGIRPSMLLAGTDFAAVQQLILRGKAADGTAPPGTAYLLSTSDPSRNVRAALYEGAQQVLAPALAVKVQTTDRLESARGVVALFTGLARVEGLSGLRFRPGAVADHLTSFGGELTPEPTPSGQMSALRWLEAGATGSYGTVEEPCNFLAKFPSPGLFLSYYRRGDTLIEAYWRSVSMPGQGVFIGEPLARPWGPALEAPAGGTPLHVRGWGS
jgi:uncharacterized protein (TIGR03790 family)